MTLLELCPMCGGERLVGDVSGLRMTHRQRCRLGEAELTRQLADRDEARTRVGPWLRPAVFAERQLLAAAGVDLGNEPLVEVLWLSPSLRRRTFTDRTGRVIDLDADEAEAPTVTAVDL